MSTSEAPSLRYRSTSSLKRRGEVRFAWISLAASISGLRLAARSLSCRLAIEMLFDADIGVVSLWRGSGPIEIRRGAPGRGSRRLRLFGVVLCGGRGAVGLPGG